MSTPKTMPELVVFVLAGNHRQFLALWAEHGRQRSPMTLRYISGAEDLRGRARGLKFVRTGTWYDNPKWLEISDALTEREAVEIGTSDI